MSNTDFFGYLQHGTEQGRVFRELMTHNKAMDILDSFVAARQRADMQIEAAVKQARQAGASWRTIAEHLGVGEDTARNRYKEITG